jgi:hypothetical protein
MNNKSIEEKLKEVAQILGSINPDKIKELKSEDYKEALDVIKFMEDMVLNFKQKINEKDG